MDNKVLYIISAAYPYGKGEEFMEKELAELSRYFSNIYLFPLYANGEKRPMPSYVKIDLSLANTKRKISPGYFISRFLSAVSIISIEFFRTDKKWAILKNFRELLNTALQAQKLSRIFLERIENSGAAYYYSVWMNDGALILSLLKRKKHIKRIFFRLHGYDLFDERRKDNYMPFRYINFKFADKVFVLSEAGYKYITEKRIFDNKVVRNYSGLYDKGINPFSSQEKFTIVSCSRVILLKRVDRIIEVLSMLDIDIRWVHFGSGDYLDICKEKARNLPRNIQYEFKGHISNNELIDFYRTNPVHLFLHLSESEGLGMAIVEAQSFGIPALAIDAGGVGEVVNPGTGILLKETSANEDIARAIKEFCFGPMNSIEFREKVRQQWKLKFEATANYKYFVDEIFAIN